MSVTHISQTVRTLVRDRSLERCEYCLIPESVTFSAHWIDHIIAEKHGGLSDLDNLANSCAICNQRKGSDIGSIDPLTSQLVPLFHPRRDRWAVHFRLENGKIVPLTAIGRATERLLRFNLPDRVLERQALVEMGLIDFES